MLNLQALSANIKMYRKAKGISQNALAAALSISPQSVSKWECGVSHK
ncbi:MAG: helix-turn-helix transcriptional regulator [Oscillospiraceae bacterium]|nr:helix-turn-helix transcriptional regulator [Oscillospiraceae bacterium]